MENMGKSWSVATFLMENVEQEVVDVVVLPLHVVAGQSGRLRH